MLAPVVRERAEHAVSCRAKLQVPSVCQRIGALKFAFDACMLWVSRCDSGRHYISGRLQTMWMFHHRTAVFKQCPIFVV
jgi:hypothetical protein